MKLLQAFDGAIKSATFCVRLVRRVRFVEIFTPQEDRNDTSLGRNVGARRRCLPDISDEFAELLKCELGRRIEFGALLGHHVDGDHDHRHDDGHDPPSHDWTNRDEHAHNNLHIGQDQY